MGWPHGSDLGWGRRPKLHGMQGVKFCQGSAELPSFSPGSPLTTRQHDVRMANGRLPWIQTAAPPRSPQPSLLPWHARIPAATRRRAGRALLHGPGYGGPSPAQQEVLETEGSRYEGSRYRVEALSRPSWNGSSASETQTGWQTPAGVVGSPLG
jgi:hypothetical protein